MSTPSTPSLVSPVASATASLSMDDISPYYHYIPTKSVCIIFVVLFSIATFLHFVAAVKYRLWWLLPTVCLAGSGEILGWAGRLWSSMNLDGYTPFMIQIVATVLAPTPLVAAVFIIFGRMTRRLGTQYSRLSPRLYSWIFLTCDIIALIVQGVGGGQAASADTQEGSDQGSKVMLGGIIFQLIALVVFMLLAAEVLIRFFNDWPIRVIRSDSSMTTVTNRRSWDIKLKLMTLGLGFTTLVLFIRSIYRTIELQDGWNGEIIRTQVYFNVLDGAMIVLAMYALIFFHPGFLMPGEDPVTEEKEVMEKNGMSTTQESLPIRV